MPDFPEAKPTQVVIKGKTIDGKEVAILVDSEGKVSGTVDVEDIGVLLRTFLNTPLARLAIDPAGRLRIIIDAAGTATPVSGTVAATKSGTWAIDAGGVFPVDQRWELIQRANIEYEECQRRKMTIT